MKDHPVVLSLERSTIIFFIEIGVTIFLDEFSLLIALSLPHFEVELILVLKISLHFKVVDHIHFLVVILRPLFVVFALFQHS